METMSPRRFRTYCGDPEQLFLGFGFDWHPVHSQRLYELAKIPFRAFLVVALGALRSPHRAQPEAEVGLPYIHGVEPGNARCIARLPTSKAARSSSARPSPAKA